MENNERNAAIGRNNNVLIDSLVDLMHEAQRQERERNESVAVFHTSQNIGIWKGGC